MLILICHHSKKIIIFEFNHFVASPFEIHNIVFLSLYIFVFSFLGYQFYKIQVQAILKNIYSHLCSFWSRTIESIATRPKYRRIIASWVSGFQYFIFNFVSTRSRIVFWLTFFISFIFHNIATLSLFYRFYFVSAWTYILWLHFLFESLFLSHHKLVLW